MPCANDQAASTVFELHAQNTKREAERDDVGNHYRPRIDQQTVHEPERYACREAAIHAQRDAAHITGTEGFEGLRNEAEGGEERGCIANELCSRHDE